MSGTILAIDLGKFDGVFCRYDPDARGERFRTAPTTPDDPRRELLRRPVARVVFEARSQAGWVHDPCEPLGVPAVVASTTGAAWQWRHVKRKTDRDDARKLARLAAVGEVGGVPVPPRAVRRWKSPIGLRKRPVPERVRGQNRIRGLLVCQGLAAPCGAKARTATGPAGIGRLARPPADCGPDGSWRGEPHPLLGRLRFLDARARDVEARLDALAASDDRASLLTTVPGVGVRTAEVIAVHPFDARRFRPAGEVGAYAGPVPRQYQGGETGRRGRITRRGPRLPRAAPVECAWCSPRYDARAREAWLRPQADGLSEEKAVVALARRLLVRCWAIPRTGRPWQPPTPAAV